MEATITGGEAAMPKTNVATVHGGAQMPLNMVSEGSVVQVAKVHGGAELRQHLSELGFVEGADVKVVSRVNGDVVVSVKGATFGLNRDMAKKITTC